MGVGEQLGIADEDDGLLRLAAARWHAWAQAEPRLQAVDELKELRSWLNHARAEDADEVLQALARRGSVHGDDDRVAAATLAWALLPRGVHPWRTGCDKQVAKLSTCLEAGDPNWEVTVAWFGYQQLRSMYQADPGEGRRIAEKVIDSFPTCPVPELARLGRTLKQWLEHVLARFDTDRISNGGTEAVNLIIERTRRLAHSFRTFEHYRLRILLAASGTRAYRRGPAHA